MGGMLLPLVTYALLLVMNSPKFAKLQRAPEGGGKQDRTYNGLLVCSCSLTAFLATFAVIGSALGSFVYVLASLMGAGMCFKAVKVVQEAEKALAAV